MERAAALARHDRVTVDDLPEKVRDFRPTRITLDADDPQEMPTLEEIERRYILRVLQAADGNRTLASRILGLDRKTLYRKLQRYGVDAAGETDAD